MCSCWSLVVSGRFNLTHPIVPSNCEPARSRIPLEKIQDLLYDIAGYLGHRDVRALSQTAQIFRKPAQRRIFESISVRLPHTDAHFRSTIMFLMFPVNDSIARFIRTLNLHGRSNMEPTTCDVHTVALLLVDLPGLIHLSIMYIRWVWSAKETVPSSARCNLKSLQMSFMHVGPAVPGGSTFPMLSAVQSCHSVMLTACDLRAILAGTQPVREPIPVCRLYVAAANSATTFGGAAEVVDSALPFSHIQQLRVVDMDYPTTQALMHTLCGDTLATLTTLDVQFQRILNDPSMQASREFAACVKECTALAELRFSHPMSLASGYTIQGDRDVCADIVFMEELLCAIPRTVRHFDLILRFTPRNPDLRASTLRATRWDHIATHFHRSQLDEVMITKVSLGYGDLSVGWTEDMENPIESAFKATKLAIRRPDIYTRILVADAHPDADNYSRTTMPIVGGNDPISHSAAGFVHALH